ncbi:MAG: Na+/H+ antiporter NhaA [Marinifilaceae bacterium]|jgi:NhaA family Na+:H+ antiporter|nr:Na+/H+ antiporter NhaA [Marinifilaceae bacterium]
MAKKILSVFQKFVRIESLGGILLAGATLLALIIANSNYADSYHNFWQSKIGFYSPNFEIIKPLILWVNDGLMAIFFFLIGLEIKREVTIGELNTLKKISFPFYGALGGMILPVVLFFIMNQNPDTLKAWGVPMATDIAFSLAVLNSLGKRVPLSLKLFLTAFAIVDDIGAVMVIAIFYSGTISIAHLAVGILLLAVLYFLSYKSIYNVFLTFFLGIIIWYLFLKSGIHPTIAGVLIAFSIPVRQRVNTPKFINRISKMAKKLKDNSIENKPILSTAQIHAIDNIEDWIEKYQSPLQHLEHKLHTWVAYFVIPIFAFANSGISINLDSNLDISLIINIIICLIIGKGLGVSSFVYLAKWLKLLSIPKELCFKQIIGVSFLAGIGFTMAIFIASLAFKGEDTYITSAKLGIFIASILAAIIGYSILRLSKPKQESIVS